MNRATVAIVVLFLIAFLVRAIDLAKTPLGFYVDEAALAYNSYSISMTGKDEYNLALPVFLRSYGTFTSALVVYLMAVPIKIWGLGIWQARITPAITGSLTVIVTFILGYWWSRKVWVAFFAGLVIALSPSHILFSRAFYEPTLAILLFSLGMILIERSRWIGGMLILSLAAYSYQPLRLIAVAMAVIVAIKYKFRRPILLALAVFALIQIPLWYLSFYPGPNSRLASLTPSRENNPVWEFTSQYISYYNPRNLFWRPDPDLQRSLPDISVFYPWMVIPYGIGLFYVLKRGKEFDLLIMWLLLAAIPASLTKDPFSTVRAGVMLPALSFVIGMGMVKYKKIFLALLICSVPFLYRSLFVLNNPLRAKIWNYGFAQMFDFAAQQKLPLQVDYFQPVYVLYLFYQKVDPRYVQNLSPLAFKQYYSVVDWENYYSNANTKFKSLVWEKDICVPQLIGGDTTLISPNQATEHFLQNEFQFSYAYQDLIEIYSTQPELKCAKAEH